MQKNVGPFERGIRTSSAFVLTILLVTHVIGGTMGYVLGVLIVYLLVTSSVGFCPIYALLGVSSRGKDGGAR